MPIRLFAPTFRVSHVIFLNLERLKRVADTAVQLAKAMAYQVYGRLVRRVGIEDTSGVREKCRFRGGKSTGKSANLRGADFPGRQSSSRSSLNCDASCCCVCGGTGA